MVVNKLKLSKSQYDMQSKSFDQKASPVKKIGDEDVIF